MSSGIYFTPLVDVRKGRLLPWLLLLALQYCLMCFVLQESVDKTYLFERVMTLPVDVNRMRMESSHHASQDSADGTHETPGVTVRQLFATGALTDGSATGGWAENKQSKANFFKKMSASESVAMTDL